MDRRVGLPALCVALAVVVVFSAFALSASFAADAEPAWVELQGGLKARLLSAIEHKPEGEERELNANFVLSDPAVIADHAKVTGVADQLFARVVLLPSETKGFKRAAVNLLISEKTVGDTTLQMFEDFHYKRGDNAVWLRQAGPEDWKLAQDPAWTAPESKEVELSVGIVYVDFFGEIFAPPGATKALGIEMRSKVAVTNIPGKYAEIRELWSRVDKVKLKEAGFDHVTVENYGEPRRGRFHVRQDVYLNMRRPKDGEWPELPAVMPDIPLIAGVGSGIDDEATRLASTGVAAAASVVPVAARREADGVTATIGIATRALPGAKAGNLVRTYLKVQK